MSNGVIIFFFQKITSNKLEKINKRNNLRAEIILSAWRKLQELNDIMIQVNKDVLIKFFDTNEYDLNELSIEFSKWKNSWDNFSVKYESSNKNSKMNKNDSIDLGIKLQNFKNENLKLIKFVREQY